jgi:hypothetical protein
MDILLFVIIYTSYMLIGLISYSIFGRVGELGLFFTILSWVFFWPIRLIVRVNR